MPQAHDLPYLVALTHFPKFRSPHIQKLQRAFPKMSVAFSASQQALTAAGIDPRMAEEFVHARHAIDPARCWNTIEQEGLNVITPADPSYPELLTKIYDPPAVLFCRGMIPDHTRTHLGIVGTRLITPYGKQITDEITEELAHHGVVVVSGLAIGVDGAAHEAALRVGGATVAVLGSGLDRSSLYPSRHRYLAEKITSEGGAVISEHPPGTLPLKHYFPERNRIIAGMSKGVLVIEAKEGSGSLITARFALDEGRDVFAVPGPLNQPTSFGPHLLIKFGAYLVTNASDILELLDIPLQRQVSSPSLEKEEKNIWDALSKDPVHIDALAQQLARDVSHVMSTLAIMEMKGLVRNVGTMHFVRAGGVDG